MPVENTYSTIYLETRIISRKPERSFQTRIHHADAKTLRLQYPKEYFTAKGKNKYCREYLPIFPRKIENKRIIEIVFLSRQPTYDEKILSYYVFLFGG